MRPRARPGRARSSGAASTPGTEIPEGGSLFDIAEPEESAPAAKSEPVAKQVEEEDPAGDSTTDANVDRSQDDADADADVTPEGETEAEPEAEAKTEDKAETQAAPAAAGSTSTPGTEIPEGGSLFDIAEPEESAPVAKSEPAAEQADEEDPAGDSTTDANVDRSQDDADADVTPEGETEAEPVAEPDAGNKTDDEPVTSLRDIKAKYADGSASDDEATGAEDETEDEPEDSEEPDESEDAEAEDSAAEDTDSEEQKPKPASSGETHQPRTDARDRRGRLPVRPLSGDERASAHRSVAPRVPQHANVARVAFDRHDGTTRHIRRLVYDRCLPEPHPTLLLAVGR